MTPDSAIWAPPTEYAAGLHARYNGLTALPRWGTPRSAGWTPGVYLLPGQEARWYDERPTFGRRACDMLDMLGTPPMPHQRYALDTALELNEDNDFRSFRYRRVGLSMTRQMGKTQTVLGAMLWRLNAFDRQRVVYAAQTRIMARLRLEKEFAVALGAARPLAGLWDLRLSTGMEAINWLANHSYLGLTATTETAGHGPPLDMGVIDEAFAHIDDRIEQAMSPAMLTRDMAQLWWASAAGTFEKSLWLNRQRLAGRALIEQSWKTGVWGDVFYVEWYEPESSPRDDPATWYRMMPALCPSPPCTCAAVHGETWRHTTSPVAIRSELGSMDAGEFDRAYLNRTRKAEPPPDPNVPTAAWPGRAQPKSKLPRRADLAFALDITPARDHASISVFGFRADGMGHSELVDRRPGADWVIPALLKLVELWSPVAIGLDLHSPAGALVDRLEQAGIMRPETRHQREQGVGDVEPRRGELWVPNAAEYAAACALYADAVARDETLVHIDQDELNTALMGARTRTLGDAWAWSRRIASVDISPLVSATLARSALLARVELVNRVYDPVANIG